MREGFVKIAELSPDSIELAWNAYDPQTGELWKCMCMVHGSRLDSACACIPTIQCMYLHHDRTIPIKIFYQSRSTFRMRQAYGNGPNMF